MLNASIIVFWISNVLLLVVVQIRAAVGHRHHGRQRVDARLAYHRRLEPVQTAYDVQNGRFWSLSVLVF